MTSKPKDKSAADAVETVVAFGKGNLEAYSAASAAALSGFEAYYGEVVDYAKKAVAQNVELWQKAYAVKTPQELLGLQIEAVSGLLDGSVAETAKLNKIASATVTNVVEPLKTRFEGTVESFVKPFFG